MSCVFHIIYNKVVAIFVFRDKVLSTRNFEQNLYELLKDDDGKIRTSEILQVNCVRARTCPRACVRVCFLIKYVTGHACSYIYSREILSEVAIIQNKLPSLFLFLSDSKVNGPDDNRRICKVGHPP